MGLNQYLDKISQGKAINLDLFIACLPYSDPLEWRRVYQATRVRGGYRLTILDAQKHNSLFTPLAQDRVRAAKFGRSHDFSGSFSHVLVLNRSCKSLVPFVVLSDNDGFNTGGQLIGKKAVVIENKENFYRYHAYLAAIGQPDLAESCDILFGSGNQICHRLNHRFLSEYELIYCAQDLDLGGLTIYQNLKNTLPQCHWLAPTDWGNHRQKFRLAPKNATQLANAIQLARELGLAKEADMMNQTRAFLEQEALLPVLPQD